MSKNSRGRALAVAGLALLALASSGGTASAAPEQRAGVFKLSFAGYVSSAAWSNCGDLADEAEGTVCSYADVMVFYAATKEQAGSEVHLHDKRSGTVKTFESACQVRDVAGEEGTERLCVPLTERFGRAVEADVGVDPRLQATTATAAVPVQVIDFVNDQEWSDIVLVTADFVGTGETRRIDERWHSPGRDGMTLEGTRGWERDCTATATFDGVAPLGEMQGCSMVRVNQSEIRVYPNAQGPR